MSEGRAYSQTTLQDVVRVLSLDSLDLIYRELKQQGCLAAARLACSWLRALVDGSVRELVVRERAPVRAPPSLARWPRCTAIMLAPRPPPSDDEDEDDLEAHETDVLLHTPFLGQPESARRRITSLRLQADQGAALRAGPAAATLASYLPCLRSLDLSSLLPADGSHPACVVTAADTALLHMALAGLPALGSVSLPSVMLLPGIEAMAGRLRSLSAGSPRRLRSGLPHYFEDFRLGAAEGVSKLSRLEVLTLSAVDGHPSTGGPDNSLLGLLNSLPPLLQRLELKDCRFRVSDWYYFTLAAGWEGGGGRLASLDLDFTQLRNPWLSAESQAPALLEQLVLPWRALQRGVRSLSIRKVAFEDALPAPLLRLFALADEAEVGTLQVPDIVFLLQLPTRCELWGRVREVSLLLPGCSQGARLSLPRQAQPPGPAQPPFQLPTPEEVWALAVQHALAATNLPDWLASQQGSGELLMLTGPPAEAGLAAAGRGELGEWLAELCREFRTALSEREAGEAQAAPLPAASCVLVSSSRQTPAAVARAVTEAVERAGSTVGGAVRRLSSTLFPWGLQQELQRQSAEAAAAGSVLVPGGLWAGSSVAAGPDLVGALLRWAVSVRGHAWFLIRPLESWPGGTRC
ncbi:hypothetical protein HYH03_003295 [Edaphochlamys debaryana]|uniref:Uncharacterized protein n=1 Tax=Edaphochlamys debaryana TaxID=47281 RepID=A0A835YJ02_9CHLO|nr:hypothetical protein HYH03_003295 [Edaphochlamys debaryana]|eukprot:KAG2498544.1 hypothetical protein HYH03_003295 [Edaphochlamys debaryana]